ncbi:porin family protein [Pontibacter sp. SGAir0037]|uniref:porin family protein n=1 Tax=Pontibacter sp. SGAir0037 TaxID=2571030 RepID=UPI0010CCB885|nr:porin family protein [Pontibacter sp. SGAir0037]QCR23538.1 PorT family protein [Pontibacter sp. SGAir0037]
MKSFLLTILAVITLHMSAQAQFSLGIKGGVSSSKVSIDGTDNTSQYRDPQNITGYHGGLFARIQVASIFIQPEALFASSGGKITFMDQTTATPTNSEEEFKFSRLDVPVTVGVNLLNFFRVQAGPVASIMLNEYEGTDRSLESYKSKTDFGLQAGVGIDISSLTLDLRYERIKRNFTSSLSTDPSVLNEQFILSLGYKFIK